MKKLPWIILVAWILFSVLLHVMPAPGRWVPFWSHNIADFYDENQSAVQSASHLILSLGLAFMLMHVFGKRTLRYAFVMSLLLATLFSLSMEWLQGFLPYALNRTCDVADLVPSLSGAFIGCCAGLGLPRPKKESGDEKRNNRS